MKIEPVTPLIGAEVSGIDLRDLSDHEFSALKDAFTQHSVLFFRDHSLLQPEEQVAFARRLGPLHTHPAAPSHQDHPDVFVIHAHKESKVANGNGWHTDVSCDEEPPLATMLQLHILPETGGDTLFASSYAAFETLSESMQNFLLTLNAHHESEHVYRGRYAERGMVDDGKTYPRALHPVICTHPQSGRRALFVNPSFTTRIDGLTKNESDALLLMLYKHQQRPEFQVRFKWSENAIALWDNRCTQHFAMWDYWPEERKGHRVTIKGDRPYLNIDQVSHRLSELRLSRQQL